MSEGHVRPIGNGTANCGLKNNRWNIVYSKNSLNVASDERIKRDIAPVGNAKELIMGLKPRQYRFKDNPEGKLHTGFIAQHVLELAPGWAAVDDEDKESLGMMYDEILAPLVQVVQDQQKRIEALEAILEKQGQNLA